ncbi:hypothetical protein MD537_05420 [Flavihumibacter sediminis]|nr:hypothetical protein [Flavihumibacter sediminis]
MHSLSTQRSLKLFAILLVIGITACSRTADPGNEINSSVSGLQVKTLQKEMVLAAHQQGNIRISFPSQDPGIPLYVRAEPSLNQYFVKDGWLVMPFYRNPDCIRPDFNLLSYFDVPAAFGCELKVEGSYIIESGAPLGTFPIISQSRGTAVPFWFVQWDDFAALAADGVVTIADVESLNPVKGLADNFVEMLKPRFENHQVVINASGSLEDGRTFMFHVNHLGNQTQSIRLEFN